MDKISFEVGGHCGGDENKNDDAETTNLMQKKQHKKHQQYCHGYKQKFHSYIE